MERSLNKNHPSIHPGEQLSAIWQASSNAEDPALLKARLQFLKEWAKKSSQEITTELERLRNEATDVTNIEGEGLGAAWSFASLTALLEIR